MVSMSESSLGSSALTIAGSDSGAGAGIQADLKTFSAHGVYSCTVLTMVTAQSTQTVDAVHILPPEWVTGQLTTVLHDFRIVAIKTGALGDGTTIRCVAEALRPLAPASLVVDPVIVSKHGHRLLDEEAATVLCDVLLPLARVVTPNIHEAVVLSGLDAIESRGEMEHAAARIAAKGCRAVLVKGGHLGGDPDDLLWDDGKVEWFHGRRIETKHTHGTGCTYSAAITANLVLGLPLAEAVGRAKEYVAGAIVNHRIYGHGVNPVNHFWAAELNRRG